MRELVSSGLMGNIATISAVILYFLQPLVYIVGGIFLILLIPVGIKYYREKRIKRAYRIRHLISVYNKITISRILHIEYDKG